MSSASEPTANVDDDAKLHVGNVEEFPEAGLPSDDDRPEREGETSTERTTKKKKKKKLVSFVDDSSMNGKADRDDERDERSSGDGTNSREPNRPRPLRKKRRRLEVRACVSFPLDNRMGDTNDKTKANKESLHRFGVNAMCVDWDKRQLFTGGRDSTIKCWSIDERARGDEGQENDDFTPLRTFDHHISWVNDVVLRGDDSLLSCSSDSTVNVWRRNDDAKLLGVFRGHSDYVQALVCAPNSSRVYSAGLDRRVLVWDVSRVGTNADDDADSSESGSNESIVLQSFEGKQGLYSLAVDPRETIVLGGSTENSIRAWDRRSGSKLFKLKGHYDNIKALTINDDATVCVSGSSDGCIKVWDLRMQRCVFNLDIHHDSVWSLATNSSFTKIMSGGRDGCVWLSEMNSAESIFVCRPSDAILSLVWSEEHERVWTSAPNGDVREWVVPNDAMVAAKSIDDDHSLVSSVSVRRRRARSTLRVSAQVRRSRELDMGDSALKPLVAELSRSIALAPAIIRYEVLNDKRRVLTQDQQGRIELWDVTKACRVADFGHGDFEERLSDMFVMKSIPKWFTVELNGGRVWVHLNQREALRAESLVEDLDEESLMLGVKRIRTNLGLALLRGLFRTYAQDRAEQLRHDCEVEEKRAKKLKERDVKISAKEADIEARALKRVQLLSARAKESLAEPLFAVSLETSVVVTSHSSGRPLFRVRACDLQASDYSLIPPWVEDAVVFDLRAQDEPKDSTRVSFCLEPIDQTLPEFDVGDSRLSALHLLKTKKMAQYLLDGLKMVPPTHKQVFEYLVDGDKLGEASDANENETNVERVETEEGTRRTDDDNTRVHPWVFVELSCRGQTLDPQDDLAAIKTFIWKSAPPLQIDYRIRAPYNAIPLEVLMKEKSKSNTTPEATQSAKVKEKSTRSNEAKRPHVDA